MSNVHETYKSIINIMYLFKVHTKLMQLLIICKINTLWKNKNEKKIKSCVSKVLLSQTSYICIRDVEPRQTIYCELYCSRR